MNSTLARSGAPFSGHPSFDCTPAERIAAYLIFICGPSIGMRVFACRRRGFYFTFTISAIYAFDRKLHKIPSSSNKEAYA